MPPIRTDHSKKETYPTTKIPKRSAQTKAAEVNTRTTKTETRNSFASPSTTNTTNNTVNNSHQLTSNTDSKKSCAKPQGSLDTRYVIRKYSHSRNPTPPSSKEPTPTSGTSSRQTTAPPSPSTPLTPLTPPRIINSYQSDKATYPSATIIQDQHAPTESLIVTSVEYSRSDYSDLEEGECTPTYPPKIKPRKEQGRITTSGKIQKTKPVKPTKKVIVEETVAVVKSEAQILREEKKRETKAALEKLQALRRSKNAEKEKSRRRLNGY